MATNDDADAGFIRSVTPLAGTHTNEQMDAIGWLVFLGMVIVLLPLLPVLIVVWLVSKLTPS